jgi:hypothetical protein
MGTDPPKGSMFFKIVSLKALFMLYCTIHVRHQHKPALAARQKARLASSLLSQVRNKKESWLSNKTEH